MDSFLEASKAQNTETEEVSSAIFEEGIEPPSEQDALQELAKEAKFGLCALCGWPAEEGYLLKFELFRACEVCREIAVEQNLGWVHYGESPSGSLWDLHGVEIDPLGIQQPVQCHFSRCTGAPVASLTRLTRGLWGSGYRRLAVCRDHADEVSAWMTREDRRISRTLRRRRIENWSAGTVVILACVSAVYRAITVHPDSLAILGVALIILGGVFGMVSEMRDELVYRRPST